MLKQPQYSPLSVEEQVCVIYAGVKGYLDKISINQIGEFEKGLLQVLNSKGSSIINSITKDKALNDKSEKDLQQIIEDLLSSFE